ncbi:MAG: glycoside hydrolase family 32 protein [Planctomycetaceae bacterium]|nr:glycoside hydrolase family 32 protein [Planctomycetaceae bacterium]
MTTRFALLVVAACLIQTEAAAQDIEFADFEGKSYAPWIATGDAFGDAPATGTLPGQMAVEGFHGKQLVNSFRNGDGSTGTLTSPEFTIDRHFISFLIGGGGHEHKTCMNLLIEGKVVQTAAGSNLTAGGSERLEPLSWDVTEFSGRKAKLQIVDEVTGGWGHVNVDQIVFTNTKPPTVLKDAKRELVADKRWMLLPVRTGAPKKVVSISVDGRVERAFDIELADSEPEWWSVLDVSPFHGKTLTISVNQIRDDSKALSSIFLSEVTTEKDLYRESLRPQFHFSPARGWNNDPNGMVFFEGQWHLFFQHNPYGWNWGNMHWGHAVSSDLMRWTETGEALYPDHQGTMFSGSAVVDWKNTSGFGNGKVPPIVLFYTAAGGTGPQSAGQGFTQGLAYSTDSGKTWTKYEKNPVLREITGGNRDPKVIWHEPSQQWIMTLYVERNPKQTIEFFGSKNLKDWTFLSAIDGFFECPDFFELPVDGDSKKTRWVLTAANSEYMLGSFDGKTFTPDGPKLPGHRGRGFYAAQTYSDAPNGRRIQIGWLQAPSPGMRFNQCMSIPLELTLRTTSEGVRLHWSPVEELKPLLTDAKKFSAEFDKPLPCPELAQIELTATAADGMIEMNVRGATITLNGAARELTVNDHRVKLPPSSKDTVTVYVDRTCLEIFAADGVVYVPLPFISPADNKTLTVKRTGNAAVESLNVHRVLGTWQH